MHAYLAGLEQASTRPECTGDVGRRDSAGFDVGRVADSAQPAAFRSFGFARAEPRDVGHSHRLVERCVVAPGIVEERDRRLIRKVRMKLRLRISSCGIPRSTAA
jgi:hypothetical protein